jgi:hypothetical protein
MILEIGLEDLSDLGDCFRTTAGADAAGCLPAWQHANLMGPSATSRALSAVAEAQQAINHRSEAEPTAIVLPRGRRHQPKSHAGAFLWSLWALGRSLGFLAARLSAPASLSA